MVYVIFVLWQYLEAKWIKPGKQQMKNPSGLVGFKPTKVNFN